MLRHKVTLTLVYDMDSEGAEAILNIGRKAMKDGWGEDLDQYCAELGGDPLQQALYEYVTAAVWMRLRELRETDFDIELVDSDTAAEIYTDEERYPGEAAAKEAVARGDWNEA